MEAANTCLQLHISLEHRNLKLGTQGSVFTPHKIPEYNEVNLPDQMRKLAAQRGKFLIEQNSPDVP
jgi:hypothetical protein